MTVNQWLPHVRAHRFPDAFVSCWARVKQLSCGSGARNLTAILLATVLLSFSQMTVANVREGRGGSPRVDGARNSKPPNTVVSARHKRARTKSKPRAPHRRPRAIAQKSGASNAARIAHPVRIKIKKRAHARQRIRGRAVVNLSGPKKLAKLRAGSDALKFGSHSVYVVDEFSSDVLFEKDAELVVPIASLTKLMTALIVLEARQDMGQILEIGDADVDRIKHTSSRLSIGSRLSRADMLHIALMSSENRAASVLARSYPGGLPGFVAAMNAKARALGMMATHFVEPTGLSSENVASARDLSKLIVAAHAHPAIARYSTDSRYSVNTGKKRLDYVNSNRLIGTGGWDIKLQKTGYITEAGRCLVMKVTVGHRPVIMVLLNSNDHGTRFADARRLRDWIRDVREFDTAIQVQLQPGQG